MAEVDPTALSAALLELPRDIAAQLMVDVLEAMMADGAPCPADLRALFNTIAHRAGVYAYRARRRRPIRAG